MNQMWLKFDMFYLSLRNRGSRMEGSEGFGLPNVHQSSINEAIGQFCDALTYFAPFYVFGTISNNQNKQEGDGPVDLRR